jgi:hypothetical protein
LIRSKSQEKRRKPTIPRVIGTRKSQPKTPNLKGIIKNRNVMILVDPNSTNNCIDIDVTKQLNHFEYPTMDLIVTIVDEQKVKGVGRCHKFSNQIQELELQIGFYALPLNDMDMVLSAQWLMQLGTYTSKVNIINYMVLKIPLSRQMNYN